MNRRVNMDKLKAERERRKGGGDFLTLPEGESAIYVCPQFRPEDELPFWEWKVHYGFMPGDKGMAVCLSHKNNPILDNPALVEQLKAIGKIDEEKGINPLNDGCMVCEEFDKGTISDRAKQQSRWTWIVVPMKTRASSSVPWVPWSPPDHVAPFNTGYGLWDSLGDKFGEVGDITDPDAATLVRIIRTGTGQKTEWDAQADIETARAPLKLAQSTRAAIQNAMAPGGPCDPYRIVASMIKSRKEIEKLLKGDQQAPADEFEPKKPDDDKSKFAPPGQGQDSKGETKTEEPKKRGPGRPPGSTNKPKNPDPPKQSMKEEPKPETVKPVKNGELDIAALTASKGSAPPSCFRVDPDSEEEECQRCPWKVECATYLGVPVPPDPVGANGEDEEPEDDAHDVVEVSVDQCELGASYLVDGKRAEYKGAAKGKYYFMTDEGESIKLGADAKVTTVPEEASDGGDDEIAKLAAKLAEQRAKLVAAKAK